MPYGVHVFRVGDIHTFIDIGANGGYISAKVLEMIAPDRIIALEPCKETFGHLLETNKGLGGILECYNIAYGCGENLYYLYKKSMGMRRFLTGEESTHWESFDRLYSLHEKYHPYPIESKTLEEIFLLYDVDVHQPYAIKMDCEGCERFLLENEEDLYYMKNATLFGAEFHFFGCDFDGTPRAESSKPGEFAHWIYDNFSDTHDIFIGRRGEYRIQHNGVLELEQYFSSKRYPYINLYLKDWRFRYAEGS